MPKQYEVHAWTRVLVDKENTHSIVAVIPPTAPDPAPLRSEILTGKYIKHYSGNSYWRALWRKCQLELEGYRDVRMRRVK